MGEMQKMQEQLAATGITKKAVREAVGEGSGNPLPDKPKAPGVNTETITSTGTGIPADQLKKIAKMEGPIPTDKQEVNGPQQAQALNTEPGNK